MVKYRIESNNAEKDYNVSEWIDHIILTYIKFYKFSNVNIEFEIEFSENVSLRKKDFFSNKKQCGNSKLDGAMVLPDPPTGKYYILLDEKFLSDKWKYDLIESFAHELTHLHDYLLFAQDNCDGIYLNIPEHDYWLAFYFWSEYHAKWIGYRCMFTQLLSEIAKEQVYNIANQRLIIDSNDTLIKYAQNIRNGVIGENRADFLYEAIRYLAKVRALNDIVPQQYQVDVVWEKYMPITKQKAIMLAKFLAVNNTYESIKDYFGDFRDIINITFDQIVYIK